MPTTKLTAQYIERLQPPAAKREEHWDTHVKGLALRVTDKGAKSWIVMYRQFGKQVRLTVGKYPAYSLADARQEAIGILSAIGKGNDPRAQRLLDQQAQKSAFLYQPLTLATCFDDYLERHAKIHLRSWKHIDGLIRPYILGAIGDMDIAALTKRDISTILENIVQDGKKTTANRLLAVTRSFLNWCVEQERIETNPASMIKKPSPEISRERTLTDMELIAVWHAMEQMGWPFGHAMQLMLLTAQRRDEVAGMRWEHIDQERALWTITAEQNKSKRTTEVPLSGLAMAILRQVPHTGEYVFSTTGKTPISGFSRAKIRCDRASGVNNWCLHDLRRTAASLMARLAIAPHVIEKTLNHSTGIIQGVAAVYNRYGYLEEKRSALETLAGHIQSLVTTEYQDNLLSMKCA
jgi:integrase